MENENQTPHKRRVHYKGKYPKKFEEKYKEQIAKHLNLELIEMTQGGFKFTQKGREISNNIFLDYID